jgi:predicted metal-dependent phosphotriesterase family hydrolase
MLFNIGKTIPCLKELSVSDAQFRTFTIENPRCFFGGR